MNYWDTSCALKLYTWEPDSAEYLRFAGESSEPLASSEVLAVELYFSFCQKEARGDLKRGAAERLRREFEGDVTAGRWLLLPAGRDVVERAISLADACYHHRPPVMLRTLDGIHLATADLAGADQIITTGSRLRAAAQRMGLALWPA